MKCGKKSAQRLSSVDLPSTGSSEWDFFSISAHALEAAPTAARSVLVVSPGSAPGTFGSPPLPASKSLVTLAMILSFSSSPHDDSAEQRSKARRTYC